MSSHLENQNPENQNPENQASENQNLENPGSQTSEIQATQATETQTPENQIYETASALFDSDIDTGDGSGSTWIAWDGMSCEPPNSSEYLSVLYRDGEVHNFRRPDSVFWRHFDVSDPNRQVVAYKLQSSCLAGDWNFWYGGPASLSPEDVAGNGKFRKPDNVDYVPLEVILSNGTVRSGFTGRELNWWYTCDHNTGEEIVAYRQDPRCMQTSHPPRSVPLYNLRQLGITVPDQAVSFSIQKVPHPCAFEFLSETELQSRFFEAVDSAEYCLKFTLVNDILCVVPISVVNYIGLLTGGAITKQKTSVHTPSPSLEVGVEYPIELVFYTPYLKGSIPPLQELCVTPRWIPSVAREDVSGFQQYMREAEYLLSLYLKDPRGINGLHDSDHSDVNPYANANLYEDDITSNRVKMERHYSSFVNVVSGRLHLLMKPVLDASGISMAGVKGAFLSAVFANIDQIGDMRLRMLQGSSASVDQFFSYITDPAREISASMLPLICSSRIEDITFFSSEAISCISEHFGRALFVLVHSQGNSASLHSLSLDMVARYVWTALLMSGFCVSPLDECERFCHAWCDLSLSFDDDI